MKGIITLCGSTKFKKEYIKWHKKLEMEGYIVLTVGSFTHADEDVITPEQKRMLDRMHLKKILMSDAIYVINPDGYIGESTRNEINFAHDMGKHIYYMGEEPWT